MKKVIFLLGIVTVGYLIHVYWSVGQDYMAIRYAAQVLANRTRQDGIRHANITKMREEVAAETGVQLYGSDVHVVNHKSGAVVEVKAKLKAHFPIINEDVFHEVEITNKARER